MGSKLPQPTARLLVRLQRYARHLDQVAATMGPDADPVAYATARAHANLIWQAVGRLEDLALLVEELAPMFDPTKIDDGDDDDEPPPVE